MPMRDALRAAEQSARASYGRLLAVLVARSGDIMVAEDALSEAFVAALRTWPINGVPDNPDPALARQLADLHLHLLLRGEHTPSSGWKVKPCTAAFR